MARDNLHQCGLSRTVRSHDGHPRFIANMKGKIPEKVFSSELFRNIL
jgi:hypothetical protein